MALLTESPQQLKLLAICGSVRRESLNRRLLVEVGVLMPPAIELRTWDALKAVPPFDEDDEGDTPLAVARLRRAVGAADGLLIATPEYNGSVPGQLKNAIDWLSRPPHAATLRGKPVAVFGASPSPFGAAWAQADLRKVLKVAGADVLEAELTVDRVHQRFDEAGRLVDERLRDRLGDFADAVAAGVTERALELIPA